MKTYSSLIALFCIIGVLLACEAHATLLRVNNNLTTDATKNIYASLQEAHDNAAGLGTDTVLIDGSTKQYAGVDCTKKLVIIGPGYFLTLNGGQANALSAVVQSINFKPGSEGSIIIGLEFSSAQTNYAPYIYANGIAIMRCHMPYGISISANITSLVVIQNYIEGNGIYIANSTITFSGVIVRNNVMNELNVAQATGYPRLFTTVEHNVITTYTIFTATTVQSNIFTYVGNPAITATTFQNNVCASTLLSSLPNNFVYNSGQTFLGLAAANNSTDGQFKLVAGSPVATAGYNGEEPGVFGGSQPYVLSGIPPIPTIYQLQSDALANKQDGLNVTIKVKANQ